MARNTARLAAAAFAVALTVTTATACDTLHEKQAGNSGGGPQNVGQNTSNNMGGVP